MGVKFYGDDLKKLNKTAYGSHDLMHSVQYFDSLSEAVADRDFIIGTSGKMRAGRKDPIGISELNNYIDNKGESVNRVAIVFGNEENGLSSDELGLCHMVSSIPMAGKYPSFNLAQAVLLYAFQLSGVGFVAVPKRGAGDFVPVFEKVKAIVGNSSLAENKLLSQRILDRLSLLSGEDIKLILTVLNKVSAADRTRH